ncbi:unnamed protein product [Prunus armeniaca]
MASGSGSHGQTTNYVLSTGIRKYLKANRNEKTGQPLATGNGETGQPRMQLNRAGGWEIIFGHLCTKSGTHKYLKATENGEIGQPPVQSNRVGGWGNHGWTTNYVLSTGTRKYLKATRNGKTGQPPV